MFDRIHRVQSGHPARVCLLYSIVEQSTVSRLCNTTHHFSQKRCNFTCFRVGKISCHTIEKLV